MANSRFEYVKHFEQDDRILRSCWIVLRLDGKGFTKFAEKHGFKKPNDERGLGLMNSCAMEVMKTFSDIRIAYGQSDEFSFVIHKSSTLYGRRSSKLVSLITSCFTGSYVHAWTRFFPCTELQAVPCFDGRAVAYPTDAVVRDYLAWRQADAHINNQYNTCFWTLVNSGLKPQEAQDLLKGTQTDFKNELLFSRFGINYNDLPVQFRKGSVIVWKFEKATVKILPSGEPVVREKANPLVCHDDIIGNQFWETMPHILA